MNIAKIESPLHCGGSDHYRRRTFLKGIGLSGLAWLTPLGELLARGDEGRGGGTKRAGHKSLILLWLDGGPSQLETFDPHADRKIAAGTSAIPTTVSDIELGTGLEQTAEQMESISLIRNVVSKEGDHERATYHVKTGYRPDTTITHPSIGAILTHQLPRGIAELPRHISIVPNQWPGLGGYLGHRFDAFKTGDPSEPIPDALARVSEVRQKRRLADLSVVEKAFAAGRRVGLEETTLHQETISQSMAMMTSEQLAAFDVSRVPHSEREPFGDTPFGRGCLAAARLIEVGARCVEVTLSGWDSHAANHTVHKRLISVLDPALASLVQYLKARDLLDDTLVLCCGEFGRTPQVNPAAGRDHWPHGFSVAMAGGGILGGRVIGETDPEGGKVSDEQGTPVANIHATVLHALGVDQGLEIFTSANRPIKLTEGEVIRELLG